MSNTAEEAENNPLTPEGLAQTLFSKPPQAAKSCQLILDNVDNEYVFELLLNVLLEGVDVLYGKDSDIADVNDIVYYQLKEYIASLGFNLNLDIKENDENVDKLIFTDLSKEDYYCQIKKNDFPDYFIEYTIRHNGHDKYKKKYRMSMNYRNHSIERNNLVDYYSIFFNDKKDKKIIIRFSYL